MTNGTAIEAAPTSTAAFLGYTSTGPVNQATAVFAFVDFDRSFGGLAENSPVSYAVSDFFNNGGQKAWVVRIVGASTAPDQPSSADFSGSEASGDGIWALERAPDVGLLCVPGQSDPDLLSEFAGYCKRRRAFFVADIPADVDTATAARGWAAGLRGRTLKSYGAAYFPWLLEPDPLQGGTPTRRSPTGAVAGLLARTDIERGVSTMAAGSGARLTGVAGLDPDLTDADTQTLLSVGVNPIRHVANAGPLAWGARTLLAGEPDPGDWKYIPVRRMALFLENSIAAGTRWAAFEPNDEPTWSALRRAVITFMQELFKAGAFQGAKPCSAYFVKCGQTTTSWAELESGVVNVLVGFAPVRPDEFSTVRVALPCGQLGI